MKHQNLLIQLNDIRYHLRKVFESLKLAQKSLDDAAECASKIDEPYLKLVVDNDRRA